MQLAPLDGPCIDGEVIAVVAAYNGKLAPIESFHAGLVSSQADAIYELMVPGTDARVVWFAMDGGSVKAVVDAEGKKYEAESDLIEARKDKKRIGLVRDAQLVRMEINGGRGSRGERDVIGKVIEILDDTTQYPLNVSKLLHSTLGEFEKASTKRGARWRRLARKAVNAAIKADKDRNLKGYKRAETLYAGYLARWSTDTDTLHITFYGRLSMSYWRKFKLSRNRPPGSRGPHPPAVSVQVEYPTEYAVDLEFDLDGKLVNEQEYPAVAGEPSYDEFPEY